MVAKDSPTADSRGLSDYKEKIRTSASRPVLSHLNADTSWLLSLAYPPISTPPPGRSRYNIVIDPWFTGAQSDVAKWFSTQYHAVKSDIQSIAALNQIIAEAEATLLPETHKANSEPPLSYIDAVVISHEFTDHCHRATLLELPRSTPIYSTSKAVDIIKSWNHFTTVINIPSLSKTTDWRTTAIAPLPSWLGISRLITEGNSLYYHSAVIICIPNTQEDAPDRAENAAEAIIYTPHGVEHGTFSIFSKAKPPISTLALLHGLHDVSITLTKQLNLGAHNAFKAQKLLKPKYWVGTHDEVKKGLGLIGPLLRRKVWTLEDAMEKARKEDRRKSLSDGPIVKEKVEEVEQEEQVPYVTCGNGETLVLA
ncbi:uncharacterized protein AB675_3982 [Cyphellophora attinorum]|uniref:Metallo-beta-lactamase domain-containing protein n=1 Tax=Cyphellophora attinorum TaxID=1664694 RepID=A0A0N1H7L1_9EURO|nr:uncharacterized protein AB675_3982 [Phialophora attinorum]KPI37604.1 hypothetical protein AB675_3982 [Phialophora attinorum]